MLYDALLLLAILFLAAAILLPFNAGEAVTNKYIIYPYYLGISFIFYGWFWTHSGQTTGLKAWKLKVLTLDKQPLSWSQAALRFATALLSWLPLGLGFLWMFVDKDHYSLHDRLSKTAIFNQTS